MYPLLSSQLSRKKDVNKSDAILIARFLVRPDYLIINNRYKLIKLLNNAKFMTQSKSIQTLWNKK